MPCIADVGVWEAVPQMIVETCSRNLIKGGREVGGAAGGSYQVVSRCSSEPSVNAHVAGGAVRGGVPEPVLGTPHQPGEGEQATWGVNRRGAAFYEGQGNHQGDLAHGQRPHSGAV